MTREYGDLDDLSEGMERLEAALDSAGTMAQSFQTELDRVNRSLVSSSRGAAQLERSLSRGVAQAIDSVVLDGGRLSAALRMVAETMIQATYRAAVRPVANQAGSALSGSMEAVFGSLFTFAKGGNFSEGRVMPFANGGVVSGPVSFPMRGGVGLMGEAGPEAIMPLSRGADGSLGVRAQGGSAPVSITMNISTPDVAGFQRSQSQIASRLSRALAHGDRNR